MERPTKLTSHLIEQFISSHEGWTVKNAALEKVYVFPHYGATIAFAVHVAFAAEKRDHHPDLHVSWGKVLVSWSTHDAGGITSLDLELAETCDQAYQR